MSYMTEEERKKLQAFEEEKLKRAEKKEEEKLNAPHPVIDKFAAGINRVFNLFSKKKKDKALIEAKNREKSK